MSDAAAHPTAAGSFGTDVFFGLVAAAMAAAVTAVRIGQSGSFVPTLLGALGGATVTVMPVVVVGRRARPAPSGLRAWSFGALLAVGPLAVLGAALKEHTHHRALGGVTYSVVAVLVVVLSFAVARRLLVARAGAVPRTLLVVGCVGSAAVLLAHLASARSPDAGPVRDFVADAVVAALAVAGGVLAPPARCPSPAARVSPLSGLVLALLGAAVLRYDPSLRGRLSERAPLTLGITACLGDK